MIEIVTSHMHIDLETVFRDDIDLATLKDRSASYPGLYECDVHPEKANERTCSESYHTHGTRH